MVRAEADALRERAAAAERELIIRCGDESDRSRCLAPILPGLNDGSREGARDALLEREESIKEEPEELSNVVMEEKEEAGQRDPWTQSTCTVGR